MFILSITSQKDTLQKDLKLAQIELIYSFS